MKKLFISALLVLLAASWGWCGSSVYFGSGKVKWQGTITGLRISAVDGTAFIDDCTAITPYVSAYSKLVITDATGHQLVGYLKSVGTGETVTDFIGGTDPGLRNGNFAVSDPSSGWTEAAGWTIVDGTANATNVTAPGALSRNAFTTPTRKLYKWSINCISKTSGTYRIGAGGYEFSPTITTSGSNAGYITVQNAVPNNTAYIQPISGPFTAVFDDFVFQQVITPSSNGIKITSVRNGDTYSFESVNNSFVYNAASYTVTVLRK